MSVNNIKTLQNLSQKCLLLTTKIIDDPKLFLQEQKLIVIKINV